MRMEFTDLFARVRVRDIAGARDWYERLLGCEPAFFPNHFEAVWAVGEHGGSTYRRGRVRRHRDEPPVDSPGFRNAVVGDAQGAVFPISEPGV